MLFETQIQPRPPADSFSRDTHQALEPQARNPGNHSRQQERSQLNRSPSLFDSGPILGSYQRPSPPPPQPQGLTQTERATSEDLIAQLEQASSPEEKVRALYALRYFSSTPLMLDAIISALADPDPGVRQTAIHTLLVVKDSATPFLLKRRIGAYGRAGRRGSRTPEFEQAAEEVLASLE